MRFFIAILMIISKIQDEGQTFHDVIWRTNNELYTTQDNRTYSGRRHGPYRIFRATCQIGYCHWIGAYLFDLITSKVG